MSAARTPDGKGLPVRWQLYAFMAALVLIASRRPSDFLHWQFYAEDGAVWFAQAYNLGWLRSLPVVYASYLHGMEPLVAGLSLLVPFRFAPLVMNFAGALVQALPVPVLLSRRCAPWGPLGVRAAFAVLYLADPNAREVHVNLTNAQWHLALLAVLLAWSAPAQRWTEKAGDVGLFALASLSGPFSIVLLPFLALYGWFRRQRWSVAQAACLLPGALLQAHAILGGQRVTAPLGASWHLLLAIFGKNVALGALVGPMSRVHVPQPVDAMASLLYLGVVFRGVRLGPLPIRLLAGYTAVLFAGSLRTPVISTAEPLWTALFNDSAARYYLFPTLLFLWAAVYLAARAQLHLWRYAGVAVLAVSGLGSFHAWEYRRFEDRSLPAAARRLAHAQPGERLTISIQPLPWTMVLIKPRSRNGS